LRAGDIDMADPIAGVAMGMVSEGDRYAILTDIMAQVYCWAFLLYPQISTILVLLHLFHYLLPRIIYYLIKGHF
ncbi:MAG: hypothetical protein PHD00_07825, partial [Bacteroidales bacterium]|nr:hypothetical protein [Bacteroidales bacterium]